YLLVQDSGPFNKAHCFNAGMEQVPADHTLLIFSDADIFVEEWDLRGQLRMAQRYDCTTGFGNLLDLTSAATRNLQRNQPMLLTPWFNPMDYSRSQKHQEFGQLCVFNRRAIETAGGWEQRLEKELKVGLSLTARRQLRVFAAPNDALRLRHE